MDPRDRLTSLSAEIAEATTELRILEEQLAYQAEVADDARLRALVAETPLADREARIAQADADRTRRLRDEVAQRIEAIRAEQDALLDTILEQAPPADR